MNQTIQKSWAFLRLILRATVIGFIILAIGIVPWSALASANLKFASSVPWAAAVMIAYLFLLLMYLRGKGWPKSTSDVRRRYLRANNIRGRLLVWSAMSGGFLACSLMTITAIGWMLVPTHSSRLAEFSLLSTYSPWMAVPLLMMGAAVAGVVEESAFRGYMQVPIEEKYGSIPAIGIVAIVFSIIHFPGIIALPVFLVGALGWGFLAYLSGSIMPGIVFHTLVNGIVWLWAFLNLETFQELLASSVLEEGMYPAFLVAAALAVIFVLGTLMAFFKLAQIRREKSYRTQEA